MPVLESLGVRAGWEIAKTICTSVPKGIKKWKFERFFGPGSTTGENFFFVFDPYQHPQPRTLQVGNRYIKPFLGRRPDQPLLGEDNVLGINALRNLNYAATAFAVHSRNGKPIQVVLDYDAVSSWQGSYICFGSADSNIRTFEIQNLAQQTFYSVTYDQRGIPQFEVNGTTFGITTAGRDIGIIVRMKNPHSPGKWLFVCAGLGEWGTSGAARYLFMKWDSLERQYKSAEFCIVIEVSRGADDTGTIVGGTPSTQR